jgi:imidazolonepropionase-like amidohydrolase
VRPSTLGFLDDLGTVEPGKLADLIVLNANPLDDIRNSNTIAMVMKNGDPVRRRHPKEQAILPLSCAELGAAAQ